MTDNGPLASFRFVVEAGGTAVATFTECSGLQAEVEVVTYEEGGRNDYVHRLPGRAKFSNITLKRGLMETDDLWAWFEGVVNGKVVRRNVSIILYDSEHNEVRRWNLVEAYPVKWVGPAFNTGSSAVSIETLELAHEGMLLG